MPAGIRTWWRSAAAACRRGPWPRTRPRRGRRRRLARIAQLDREIATLEAQLADPALYARDAAGFAARGSLVAKKQAERAAAEEEWLRLEMLREELEA
ncbi:hypothetical protein J4558_15745 [Leptolyngbya sp. 15MV]|nr:hypothetical protein J4558_15745 [Leptolyngbya sp. 15MV]